MTTQSPKRKTYRFFMNLDSTSLGRKLFDTLEKMPSGCSVVAQVYPDGFVATILDVQEAAEVQRLLGGDPMCGAIYLSERSITDINEVAAPSPATTKE